MTRTTPERDCGTAAAFRAHRQRAEDCEFCETAQAKRVRADQRARLKAIHAAGGSAWGAVLHRWLGGPPCARCRAAENAARAANKRRARARRLAHLAELEGAA